MTNDNGGPATARLLMDAGCISTMSDEPFRLPSGWASPVYMDCRRLVSFPALRQTLLQRALTLLRAQDALDGVSAIAGGEASGIAFAAWIADALGLPLQYVRKGAAGHTPVEGVVEPGSRVLLVDDLMAAGLSKERFVRALAARGASVTDIFVVFDYGTFGAADRWRERGVRVHALCSWHDVLAAAPDDAGSAAPSLAPLAAFVADPARWSADHGGIAASPLAAAA